MISIAKAIRGDGRGKHSVQVRLINDARRSRGRDNIKINAVLPSKKENHDVGKVDIAIAIEIGDAFTGVGHKVVITVNDGEVEFADVDIAVAIATARGWARPPARISKHHAKAVPMAAS